MQAKDHWGKIYSTKAAHAVSWFQPHADFSVGLIKAMRCRLVCRCCRRVSS
jgi:hypothetical protein